MSSKKSKSSTPAAKLKKLQHKYLTPIAGPAGAPIGYRFAPGPHLRAKGAVSQVLKHNDGRFYSLAEAQAHREAAIARAAGAAIDLPAPKTQTETRTLQALWDAYLQRQQKLIAQNQHLPPDRRDEDVIKPDTLRFYRSMIQRWLDFAGDTLVVALDGELIRGEYKSQKRKHGHHAAHAGLRALQAVLAHGKAMKWLKTNEALQLGLARPKGRLRLASPAEVAALVSAADALAEAEIEAARAAAWSALRLARALNGSYRSKIWARRVGPILFAGMASALNYRAIGDAVVAAVWTGQRQQDLLSCDLTQQMRDGCLIFARTHEGDYSQQKVRDRVEEGGQAQIEILPPLAERLDGRRDGFLIRLWNGLRFSADYFRHLFEEVRAAAANAVPSVAGVQFRDLRDTAVTRLDEAEVSITDIPLWTGHSLKTIHAILQEHYLVTTRARTKKVSAKMEAWRQRSGVKW